MISFVLLWASPYLLSAITPMVCHLGILAECLKLSNILGCHPFHPMLIRGQLPQTCGWSL